MQHMAVILKISLRTEKKREFAHCGVSLLVALGEVAVLEMDFFDLTFVEASPELIEMTLLPILPDSFLDSLELFWLPGFSTYSCSILRSCTGLFLEFRFREGKRLPP